MPQDTSVNKDEIFLSAEFEPEALTLLPTAITSLDFLLAGCQTELEDIVDQLSIPSQVTVGAIVSTLQFIREYCEEKNYTLTPEGIAHLDTYIKKYVDSI